MLRTILLALGVSAIAGAAEAALTPIGNPADLPAELTATGDFASVADGFRPAFTLFPATAAASTFTAAEGLFFGGGILSTNRDEDAVVVDFAAPVIGFGFTGGIVDETFAFIDGTFDISVDGATESFASIAGTVSFAGVVSDVPFTQAIIEVATFDLDETSVAFIGAESAVAVVPLPAALPLLATGLGVLVYASHRRRSDTA